ncbi:MAG: helix-turn-helix domain-containing protein [Pseudomonadota bacterium]|nr:helix-turn-helix domain-containing protein [Pseudomonadota bacterium]
MRELDVIESPAAAALLLEPIKSRILAELGEPASAATVAQRVGLPRQKVGYHLRALEQQHLVESSDERRWGGITERLMVASARSYVVSPAALGGIAADPQRNADRMSASYLIALAARIVKEVGALWRAAHDSDKRLATLSIDTVIRFKSPADRAAFTSELSNAITQLAARYHDDKAPRGRSHRVVIAAYPAPEPTNA